MCATTLRNLKDISEGQGTDAPKGGETTISVFVMRGSSAQWHILAQATPLSLL